MLPVHLGGKRGVISAAVVRGKAPLLISRAALQKLKATMTSVKVLSECSMISARFPLKVNEAGQYVLPLIDDTMTSVSQQPQFEEVMVTAPEQPTVTTVPSESSPDEPPLMTDHEQMCQDTPEVGKDNIKGDNLRIWVREDWGASNAPISVHQGPSWKHVVRRIVRCADSHKVLF